MMVRGNITLRDFTDEGLRDPAVLAMADKVSYRASDDKYKDAEVDHSLSRPVVEIRTRDGRVLSRQPRSVPGDPHNPVSQELLEAKFRDCVAFSAKPIPGANVERAIELIRDLENVANVTDVIRLLT
jgi:2-methylcitrate dehydratase PrpD